VRKFFKIYPRKLIRAVIPILFSSTISIAVPDWSSLITKVITAVITASMIPFIISLLWSENNGAFITSLSYHIKPITQTSRNTGMMQRPENLMPSKIISAHFQTETSDC
jgi:hypothetical protein